MNVIQNAIKQKAGRNGEYADLLSVKATGDSFIQIYQSAMNKVLPDLAQAQALGITYLPSVVKHHCSAIAQSALQSQSSRYNTQQEATGCCTGSAGTHGTGKCADTLFDIKDYIKRNAAGKQDGGQYAAQKFIEQRYMTQYSCDKDCLNQPTASTALVEPVVKTSKGTCITYDTANGCVQNYVAGSTDCRSCAGIFSNVAAEKFTKSFPTPGITQPKSKLGDLIARVQTAQNSAEPAANVLQTSDAALLDDDTAICHTESSFSCPGGDANFLADVQAGTCVEKDSVKIDKMCDDGPCDNDPDSSLCQRAKANCEVDPDSGVKCMPNSPNDPCANCVKRTFYGSNGEIAALSGTCLMLLASFL